MPSKLDQLKSMTVVVADTGDLEAIKTFRPVDCTTNPSLVLKAAELPQYKDVIDGAVAWGAKKGGSKEAIAAADTRLKGTAAHGTLWIVEPVSWTGLATLYRHGALIVGNTPVFGGCLAATRA